MQLLAGFAVALAVLALFRFFEKRRVPKIGSVKYVFVIFVMFCAWARSPFENFLWWIGWTALLYSVLDDMLTKTLNVWIPIAAAAWFLALEKSLSGVWISLAFFLPFLAASKVPFPIPAFSLRGLRLKAREAGLRGFWRWIRDEREEQTLIGEADAYILLLLACALGWQKTLWALYLASLLGAIFFGFVELYRGKGNYPFAPFLALGGAISLSASLSLAIGVWSLLPAAAIFALIRRFGKNG